MRARDLRTCTIIAFVLLTLAACGDSAPATSPTPTSIQPAMTEVTATPENTSGLEVTPTSAAETDLYEVLSPTTYLLANGDLHVAGIIKYRGSALRIRPEVTLSFKDAADAELASHTASDVIAAVKPGGLIPYNYRKIDPPDNLATIKVSVASFEPTELELSLGPYYADFETQQTSIELPPATEPNRPVKVVGTVKNTGAKSVTNVTVSVVLYYADGRVADVVSTSASNSTLAPGESSEFEAESLIATLEKQPVTKIDAVAYARVDE